MFMFFFFYCILHIFQLIFRTMFCRNDFHEPMIPCYSLHSFINVILYIILVAGCSPLKQNGNRMYKIVNVQQNIVALAKKKGSRIFYNFLEQSKYRNRSWFRFILMYQDYRDGKPLTSKANALLVFPTLPTGYYTSIRSVTFWCLPASPGNQQWVLLICC